MSATVSVRFARGGAWRRARVNSLVLRDEEVHRANVERVQQRDVDCVIRPADGAEARFEHWLRWGPDALDALKLLDLAERDPAASLVLVAVNVVHGGLVHKDAHAVLGAHAQHRRELRGDLLLVLEPDEDVSID